MFFKTVKVNVYLSRAVTEGEAEAEAEAETCFLANKFFSQNSSGQEIKVITSFGHSVKNSEGGDGNAF